MSGTGPVKGKVKVRNTGRGGQTDSLKDFRRTYSGKKKEDSVMGHRRLRSGLRWGEVEGRREGGGGSG